MLPRAEVNRVLVGCLEASTPAVKDIEYSLHCSMGVMEAKQRVERRARVYVGARPCHSGLFCEGHRNLKAVSTLACMDDLVFVVRACVSVRVVFVEEMTILDPRPSGAGGEQ